MKQLAGFLMQSVVTTPLAIFLELNALRIALLVLLGRVVTAFTFCARHGDQCTHRFSSLLRRRARQLYLVPGFAAKTVKARLFDNLCNLA